MNHFVYKDFLLSLIVSVTVSILSLVYYVQQPGNMNYLQSGLNSPHPNIQLLLRKVEH